ncbi:hypothetical protein [Anaerospora hongkongensis]
MLLILLEYVFNLGFFAVAVYLALLLMEKIRSEKSGPAPCGTGPL